MKITTLLENTSLSPTLTAEHGLSLYIETGDKKLLFDAGQTGAFADNAERLGIDLAVVDMAVLSHGHYDHGGGLVRFLEINDHAPIYVNQNVFGPHYNGRQKYIGLDPALQRSDRLVPVGEEYVLVPGMTLGTCNSLPRAVPTEPFGLTQLENGQLLPEDFRHEQYLLIEENGKRVLLSGCSHKGILNILHWYRPDVLIGGFHFKQLDPHGPELQRYGGALAQFDTVFYTGHCTGQEQFAVLKSILGDRLNAISTGSMIEL